MSDLQPRNSLSPEPHATEPGLFSGGRPSPDHSRRGVVFGALGAAIVIALIALVVSSKSHGGAHVGPPNTISASDPYAPNLSFTQLAMSQSTSLSGGTSTFIDGHVSNTGPSTVTGVTMQVVFRNDVDLAPAIETLPLSLIRMHEPYIDTEPVSAAPLQPGADVDFRLIFESIPANWNQQMPELITVHVTKR